MLTNKTFYTKVNELLRNVKGVLKQDKESTFTAPEFEEEFNSTILVRERARGSKFETVFSKKRRRALEETQHTIGVLPQGGKEGIITLAKRDVAKANCPPPQKMPKRAGRKEEKEEDG